MCSSFAVLIIRLLGFFFFFFVYLLLLHAIHCGRALVAVSIPFAFCACKAKVFIVIYRRQYNSSSHFGAIFLLQLDTRPLTPPSDCHSQKCCNTKLWIYFDLCQCILCICFVLSGRTLIIIIIVKANKFRALFFCCECTLKLSTCKRRICHLNLIRIVWELVNAALWPVTPAWFSLTIAQLAQCCQRAKQTVFFFLYFPLTHTSNTCLLASVMLSCNMNMNFIFYTNNMYDDDTTCVHPDVDNHLWNENKGRQECYWIIYEHERSLTLRWRNGPLVYDLCKTTKYYTIFMYKWRQQPQQQNNNIRGTKCLYK